MVGTLLYLRALCSNHFFVQRHAIPNAIRPLPTRTKVSGSGVGMTEINPLNKYMDVATAEESQGAWSLSIGTYTRNDRRRRFQQNLEI